MCLHHTDWKIHLKMSFHFIENSYHYEKYLRNGKNTFCQLQNLFPQARIATSEFQKLQQSSEKKILLLLHRKPVSTSQNEEFIKKYVSNCRKNCFHSQEYLANRKKLFFPSQKDSFYQEQRCFSLKIGLQASIMVSTSKNSK